MLFYARISNWSWLALTNIFSSAACNVLFLYENAERKLEASTAFWKEREKGTRQVTSFIKSKALGYIIFTSKFSMGMTQATIVVKTSEKQKT